MDNCYVPNSVSSQYGLEFQDPILGTAPITPTSTSTTQPQFSQCIWNFNPEEMGSFSISSLDLQDPVTSNFFSFNAFSSTPTNSYKNDIGCFLSKQNSSTEIKQPHDMADVLLSLKHAIVHPGQLSPTYSPPSCYQSAPQCAFSTGPSASLSCTVYPHQVPSLPSETDTCDTLNNQQYSQYMNTFPEQIPSQGCGNNALMWTNNHSQPFFPAMSVNVSMNMTMHGYPPSNSTTPLPIEDTQSQLPYHQLQWTSLTPSSSPGLYQTGGSLPSPNSFNNCTNVPTTNLGSTYSFCTDLKSQQIAADSLISAAIASVSSSSSSLASPPLPPPLLPPPPPSQQLPSSLSPSSSLSSSPLPFKIYNSQSCNYHSPCTSPFKRMNKSMTPTMELDKNKPNLCRICGKTYARPSTLKTHLRTHSGEKPYRCEDCNKSFSQAANLTAHVRTHSGEKPFCCPICGRRFSQSSSVTTHMRTHSGERPYRCRLCKKAFSDSSTLTKHLRIHSGEKPYQCKLCQLRFSQSGNLNRHMRVHSTLGANILFST